METLEWIPLFCRQALEYGLDRHRAGRMAREAEDSLLRRRRLRQQQERAWLGRPMPRERRRRLRAVLERGREEVDLLARALGHLRRWSEGGDPREVRLAWWLCERAHRCWRSYRAGLVDLAPLEPPA